MKTLIFISLFIGLNCHADTIYRLKSYKFNVFVSATAYESIKENMSYLDYFTHSAIEIEIDSENLNHLKYKSGLGYFDYVVEIPDEIEYLEYFSGKDKL